MIALNRITTKTGDDGSTGLANGDRVPKHAERVQAIGDVDEVNSWIGLAAVALRDASNASGAHDLLATLLRTQNDLFDLGADLATPYAPHQDSAKVLRVREVQVTWIEAQIEHYNQALAPLRSFVLPGGSDLAAHLHVTRTIARRAERAMVQLQATDDRVNRWALVYMNRLSDLLFILARLANNAGNDDILWQPGHHQSASP